MMKKIRHLIEPSSCVYLRKDFIDLLLNNNKYRSVFRGT